MERWNRIFLVSALILYPLIPAWGSDKGTSAPVVRLERGWEYRPAGPGKGSEEISAPPDTGEGSNWHPTKALRLNEQREGLGFWFRVALPDVPWDDSQVLLQTDAPVFAAFLDDSLIYRFGDPGTRVASRFPDLTWHLLPLPRDFQKRRLYLWIPDLRPYDVFLESASLAQRRAFPRLISENAKAPFRKDFLQNPLSALVTTLGLSGFLPEPLRPGPDFVSQTTKAPFRRDVLQIPLGTLFAALGLSALILSLFPWRSRDSSLIYFGVFSLLYGVRLVIDSYSARFLIPAPAFFWPHLSAVISYLVTIPFTLFAEQFLGKGWKNTIRWSVVIQFLFATGAIAADAAFKTPYSAGTYENLLAILVVLVILGNGVRRGLPPTPELRVMDAGFLIFALFLTHENLMSLGVFPINLGLEALGLMCFIGCLGYAAARRFFTRERRMAALEQELETARRIQFSILPRQTPAILGLDIATRYLPMASVAGDFYDFLPVDDHGLSILVADVSGHGVPAALIASMVKVAFASQASRASDPARILAGMNQALCGGPEDRFITAGCLFLDTGKCEMVYAGAGHPPLFLWRKGEGRIREFSNNGLVMGPFPEARYENATLALEPGDRMVMYTDGITEARNATGEFFGEERFKEFIQNHEELPAGRFTDALIAYIAAWSGKKSGRVLDDDLTLVVVDSVGRDTA
jgi:sigma-B regulation protein RsbU (phosphoserine phosphatase)